MLGRNFSSAALMLLPIVFLTCFLLHFDSIGCQGGKCCPRVSPKFLMDFQAFCVQQFFSPQLHFTKVLLGIARITVSCRKLINGQIIQRPHLRLFPLDCFPHSKCPLFLKLKFSAKCMHVCLGQCIGSYGQFNILTKK